MEYKIQNKKQGFTLLELLLVIAIIAVLAGIITFALRPAENIQNAQNVRAESNAADIKKALDLYALDHEGQYPTTLQAEFDSGLTRVDICASGETCNGLDLTTPLVTEGYLSTIPIHATYGSTTDSGYDIFYNAQNGIEVTSASSFFLLQDKFTNDSISPITSPLSAVPGPGQWTVVQPNNKFDITSGYFRSSPPDNLFPNNYIYAGPYNRTSGLAFLTQETFRGRFSRRGWASSPTPTWSMSYYIDHTLNNTVVVEGAGSTGVKITHQGASGMGSYPTATPHWMATVVRSEGAYFIRNISNQWFLEYVSRTNTDSQLYSVYSPNADSAYFSALFEASVVQLPAPFNTDYDLATDRKAGNVAEAVYFDHEADSIIEYTVTSLGTGFMRVYFRMQGAGNYWQVAIGSDGSLTLLEYVNGTPTARGTVGAGTVTNGHRIVIVADGTTIKLYSNNTLRFIYSSASNFVSETEGWVGALNNGEISDLIAWPRTLSGEAAEVLENAAL